MTLGTKIRSNRHLRQTCIYMIAQSVPLQTKGHTRAMCIYTMGRRPPLPSSESQLEISEVSTDQKKTSVHVFQFKIGQATDLCSRHPNTSHPQDDDCKGKKKNRDLQEKDRLSCKSHLLFLPLSPINNNNIKKEAIMQAIKSNTKEETIRKFKQLLRHKQEMLERAKQYDGIDIYAKYPCNSRKK